MLTSSQNRYHSALANANNLSVAHFGDFGQFNDHMRTDHQWCLFCVQRWPTMNTLVLPPSSFILIFATVDPCRNPLFFEPSRILMRIVEKRPSWVLQYRYIARCK